MLPVMEGSRSVPRLVSRVIKGAAIGAANTVPGVSGGTIAVVTGIYDDVIGAISDLFSTRWRLHVATLAPIAVGALLGILAFARVIEWGLATVPEQTYFFFFGLIAGSLPPLMGEVRGAARGKGGWVITAIAFAALVAVAVTGDPADAAALSELTVSTGVLLIVTGAIAAATMVVPGVSGSFVLLVLGMYQTVLRAITAVDLAMIALIGVGAALGIIAAGKAIAALLSRFHAATYHAIIGLVAGSLIGIWPGVSSLGSAAWDLVAIVVGTAAALLLGARRAPSPSPDARTTGDKEVP